MPSRHPSSAPPEAWEPLLRLRRIAARPLERFLGIQASSGVLLLVAAVVALVWANSPWSSAYFALWDTPLGIRVGGFAFTRTLAWVVNDGLMVIFFFVVGLEIRRELHHGELADRRRASLPVAAALGGMVVPAALYLAFAGAPATRSGWGVPMATDIAFALGVLALLGPRAPAAMRVFLLALAVIDDLGAIIVIALFYTAGVEPHGFAVAAAGFVGILIMRGLGVRAKRAYIAPGLVVWGGIYAAGIHPTIAGVLLGLMTPVRAWLGPEGFVEGMKAEVDKLSAHDLGEYGSPALASSLEHVDVARREAMSPAEALIETLHPWVAYGIMPVFALANAGVALSMEALDARALAVSGGIVVGLVAGKPLGVLLACALAIRSRLGVLPLGMTARHVVVIGMVAGIGFTMSLFIAQLAFADPTVLAAAKAGVLVASLIAAVLALVVGRLALTPAPVGVAATADEAEASAEL